LVLGVALLLTALAWSGSLPWLYLVSTALLLWLVALQTLWIRLDDEGIEARGWAGVHAARWSEVTAIVQTADLPYPRNKCYGPSCYEVRTPSRSFIVNLLYFPPQMSRSFTDYRSKITLARRDA